MIESIQEYREHFPVQISSNMGNIIKIPGRFDLISEKLCAMILSRLETGFKAGWCKNVFVAT
jgi:hypothetical protein